MEFNYVVNGCVLVPDEDLDEMVEQVVEEGASVEEVVADYIASLDDGDFYNMFAFDYKIINEVERRVKTLKEKEI